MLNINGLKFEETPREGLKVDATNCPHIGFSKHDKWQLFRWLVGSMCRFKPAVGATVIVAGGLAKWDGEHWLSQCHDSWNRPITWEVKWWLPLLY
jgi:hypothetical protein